jgi:hypothetical protein
MKPFAKLFETEIGQIVVKTQCAIGKAQGE